ncbi:MAG: aminoglycoside phosphotransferase family protein [Candidatus Latescibacterota bacterium]|nr:aminoglycoside phosphotransferase family protein [Candidatus Latescibacterota bacterium]MEE2725911.1 aminoglycoside phosphotransferase family protein [Candidatus Latescibacterota bacterium]
MPVSLWGQQRLSLEGDTLPSALDAAIAPRAHGLLRDLLNAPNKPVLLHGDVHRWNLLRVGDEAYGAIDPKGCYGDPLYIVIAWLRNWPAGLAHFPNPSDAMQKRVEWLSHELGYPVK